MLKLIRIKQLGTFATNSIFKQNCSTKLDNMVTALTSIYTSEAEVAELKSVQNEIVDYLTNLDQFKSYAPLRDFYKNMIEYNVEPSIVGTTVFAGYKYLAEPADLTKENIKLANVLAWCTEAVAASILMLDDVLDGSPVRRGKLAWYKLNNVGLEAANHGWMLEKSIHLVLSKYFSDTNKCKRLMELFQQYCFTVCSGQMLESMLIKNGKPQLELYTPEFHRKLIYLKAACPLVRYPYTIISTLAGRYEMEQETALEVIALKMGFLLQTNNDFYGCFDSRTEKEEGDTDVSKGKCTWLVVQALQQANPAQKKIIENYYGRPGIEAEIAIRNLYAELELPKQYEQYEKGAVNDCVEYIQNCPNKAIRDTFGLFTKVSDYLSVLHHYSNEAVGNSHLLKLQI